jgi:hypothetical protein
MTLSRKIKPDNKLYDTQHTHKNITIGTMTGRITIKSDNQQNDTQHNQNCDSKLYDTQHKIPNAILGINTQHNATK